MQLYSYAHTLKYLLLTDFKLLKRTIVDKLINLIIWVSTNVFIFVYLMPAFGLKANYSGFIIASLFASAGLFEQFNSAIQLVADFEGPQISSYYLTLPIPSWLVFVRSMVFFTFNTAVLSSIVLPLAKLAAWNHFDLSQLNLPKLCVIFVAFNAFYSSFTLLLASLVHNMEKIGNIWMRFVFPLWFLGGFQYSLKVICAHWPMFGFLALLNPITYVMEATRMAVINEPSLLNFWACICAILLFTFGFGTCAIWRLKRRLDFV